MSKRSRFGYFVLVRTVAFTLTELLAVIGIVALLAAIFLPVLGRARRAAHRTTAVSEMKQCASWLVLYEQDNENDLPSRETAASSLGSAITCDPGDTWRSSCSIDWGVPLVGSFGYVGALPSVGPRIVQINPQAPLLIDLFYADPAISPFRGFGGETGRPDEYLYMPSLVLTARQDTSVKVGRPTLVEQPRTAVSWLNLFVDMSNDSGT